MFREKPQIEDEEIIKEFRDKKDFKLNGQEAEDYNSILAIKMGDKNAEFLGLTFNETREYNRKIPSERASRETADYYARFI